ncbi:MAG: DUF3859 domain-containing protein [Gammaproteobacteria bacterium]|nr:DUF3859 domain-containing protein [Gammaproteobacteria bacterium]
MKYSLIAGTAFIGGMVFVKLASAAPGAEIIEFGYYEVQNEGQRFEDPNVTSGVTQAGPIVKLIQQTDDIPIEAGRMFGFRFRLKGFSGKEDIVIREVVTHPSMSRPGQKASTGYEVKLPLIVRRGELIDYAGYSLNHDYEMVEGDWRFEFWYEDKKLLEQKFKTVKN